MSFIANHMQNDSDVRPIRPDIWQAAIRHEKDTITLLHGRIKTLTAERDAANLRAEAAEAAEARERERERAFYSVVR